MKTAIDGDVVLDASAIARVVLVEGARAASLGLAIQDQHVEVHAPTHVDVELASTFLKYVRARTIALDDAQEALREAARIVDKRWPLPPLLELAFPVALERSLSAYDACYATLAEQLDAPLVTADRTLAARTARSVLIA